MKVVIAVDKFKGSLTADEAARAVASGVRRVVPEAEVVVVPVADGGDGTVDAAVSAGFERVPVACSGPMGEAVASGYARRGDEAVVELADACGLLRLDQPVSPDTGWLSSTRGLGQVMRAAIAAGARRLVVGLGGSASTDGGAGMLEELGVLPAGVWDEAGPELQDSPLSLDIAAVAGVEIVVASDVAAPLLGPRGAASVFGPQKGLDVAGVARAEERLRVLADRVEAASGRPTRELPGAGAAGGTGWALLQLGATMRPGIEVVLEWSRADAAVAGADLVITGEGRLDAQTLQGKAPAGVARLARRLGVPVAVLAGRIDLDACELSALGLARWASLVDAVGETVARADAGAALEGVAADILSTFTPIR